MARTKVLNFVLRRDTNVRELRTFELQDGKVNRFRVQLTVRVKGKWLPVIRWDNAHGFVDCDRYDLNGKKEKTILNATAEQGLTLAQTALNRHWEHYRDRFLNGEMP